MRIHTSAPHRSTSTPSTTLHGLPFVTPTVVLHLFSQALAPAFALSSASICHSNTLLYHTAKLYLYSTIMSILCTFTMNSSSLVFTLLFLYIYKVHYTTFSYIHLDCPFSTQSTVSSTSSSSTSPPLLQAIPYLICIYNYGKAGIHQPLHPTPIHLCLI